MGNKSYPILLDSPPEKEISLHNIFFDGFPEGGGQASLHRTEGPQTGQEAVRHLHTTQDLVVQEQKLNTAGLIYTTHQSQLAIILPFPSNSP